MVLHVHRDWLEGTSSPDSQHTGVREKEREWRSIPPSVGNPVGWMLGAGVRAVFLGTYGFKWAGPSPIACLKPVSAEQQVILGCKRL